jgi:hypothetical protein
MANHPPSRRRRDAQLPPAETPTAVYIVAALAALGVGTVVYWLYLLASTVL